MSRNSVNFVQSLLSPIKILKLFKIACCIHGKTNLYNNFAKTILLDVDPYFVQDVNH